MCKINKYKNVSIKRHYSTFNVKNNKSNQLGPYLAGLIEGDGSIYTPKEGLKTVPQIEITFDIRDIELFKKIQSILGGGYINIRSNGNSGRLIIRKQEILLKLVLLLNGHMRTPKIEALHRLILWFNIKNNSSIPLLDFDTVPLKDSSWLSGMLEADGSFYLNWKYNKNDMPIAITYYLRISQKQTYTRKLDSSLNESNLQFMDKIAKSLNTNVTSIVRDKSNYTEKAYEVRTDTIDSRLQLFNYLNNYPLFGYKYYSQIYLYKIHNLVIEKEYKTFDGKNKLLEYSNLMKYDTTKDNTWEHLSNFYSN